MSSRPEWPRSINDRLRGRDGFTLIEVLVAFSVMGMLLSVLFRGVVAMRAGSNTFDDRAHAVLVARALLDEALAHRDARTGTLSGMRDGRRWTLVATAIDLSAQLGTPAPRASAAPSSQDGLNATSSRPAAPNPGLAKPAETWAPQRLVIRVLTTGRPIEVETIRLVRAE
jgi:prepilin-type N-terminal cleavage/methylation domain-containing protein